MKCQLCPRRCNAERSDLQNTDGYCRMPLLPKTARADLHFWEEPCISGKNGSGTVFFSGCTLSCIYCQNYEISQGTAGKIISIERLSEIFRELEQKGAHNINLVTPTHYALTIKRALDIYKPNIPIVYNSSGFETVETLKMLEGYIDIYLMDFKYLSNDRAKHYSDADNYPDVAKNAISECYRQQPRCVFEDGIMKKGLIIRHLVLPRATGEAISIFEWVKNNTPNAYFSLMSQYLPCGKAVNDSIIDRKITKREYQKILDVIYQTDFQNVYIQEMDSADKKYIPKFNLNGVKQF